MRNWMKSAGHVALVGAGFFAIGSGIASADVSDNYDSVLSGNQIEAPISAPINVSGNALGLLGGSAHARSTAPGFGGRWGVMRASERRAMISSNRRGILSGNQVQAPISVPVNVCGNSVAGLHSLADASCTRGAPVAIPVSSAPVQTCGSAPTTWTAPMPACESAPVQQCSSACQPAPVAPEPPTAPTPVCQPVAPEVKPPCESTSTSSIRTLPSSMTSVALPSRRNHTAAQEVTTYEKLTNVRQAAGMAVDGLPLH